MADDDKFGFFPDIVSEFLKKEHKAASNPPTKNIANSEQLFVVVRDEETGLPKRVKPLLVYNPITGVPFLSKSQPGR